MPSIVTGKSNAASTNYASKQYPAKHTDMTQMKLDLDYDHWKHPHYYYNGKTELTASSITRTGVHSLVLRENAPPLDFLSEGFNERISDSFLVVLGGAISENTRRNSSPPYFSGTGIAADLGLPLFAVSDPTLTLNRELTLGWYAGNQYTPDIYTDVAHAIDSVAQKTGLRPILIGGSGGGYAAIQLLSRLKTSSTALVWNPQTSIGAYYPGAVRRYVSTAYPRLKIPPGTTDSITSLQQFMDINLDKALVRLPKPADIPQSSQLIYLQNKSDEYHMLNHAGTWLKTLDFRQIGKGFYHSSTKNLSFFVGEWGNGHAAPPPTMIKVLLGKIVQNNSMAQIGAYLSTSAYASKKNITWFKAAPSLSNLAKIHVSAENSILSVSVNLPPELGDQTDFQYAFEIYRDSEMITQLWYQSSPIATFDIGGSSQTYRIKIYLKDRLGAIKSITIASNP